MCVDDGAKQALLKGGKSLLLPGIVSWEGHFKKGDVIIKEGGNTNGFCRISQEER